MLQFCCKFASVFLLFDVSPFSVTSKSGLEVTQGHSNWYHSKAWAQVHIRLS